VETEHDFFCLDPKNQNKGCVESIIWNEDIPLINIWNVLCESWLGTGRRLEFNNFCSLVSILKGKHVATLCARYWYRGILEQVTPNYIVLSSPHVVKVTGISQGEKPCVEFSIKKGNLIIPITAIEILTQPKWCFAPVCQVEKDFNQVSSMGWLSAQRTKGTTGKNLLRIPITMVLPKDMEDMEAMGEWEECKNTIVEPHKGDRVAIVCNRYRYRGEIKSVTDDCVVLEKAIAVEVTSRSKIITEDWIGSDVFIPRATIEMICRPKWCEAPLELEQKR